MPLFWARHFNVMGRSPVTMRDVATRCGVSQATVSLALNGSRLISERTKVRVLAVVKEMAYRKHPLIAAHMHYRRNPRISVTAPILALVNTQPTASGWSNAKAAILRQMFAGAKDRGTDRGYNMQEFWLHEPGMTHARLSSILKTRAVTGLLIGPSSDHELDLNLDWDSFSAVRLGSAHLRPLLHCVSNDHHMSAMLAVQELYRLGYRHPGLVVVDALSYCHDRRWEAGFTVACQQLPKLNAVPTLLIDSIHDRNAFLSWYEHYRPDVVIDADECTLLDHLHSAGYEVPRTVGVATLASPSNQAIYSGTVQDGYRMGAEAADLLVTLVERNEAGIPERAMTQMTRSFWNPGKTLQPQPFNVSETTILSPQLGAEDGPGLRAKSSPGTSARQDPY